MRVPALVQDPDLTRAPVVEQLLFEIAEGRLELDELPAPLTPAEQAERIGLCTTCLGTRYTPSRNPKLCPHCGGSGLGKSVHAAQADAARLSVDWVA